MSGRAGDRSKFGDNEHPRKSVRPQVRNAHFSQRRSHARALVGGSSPERPERGRMSQADLLRLLELAHPGRPQADLLAMIEATPDRPGARAAGKPQEGHSSRRGTVPARRPQRPPQRAIAIERRRRLASSGPLPPAIACRFTTGELAVLRIVGDEVAEGRSRRRETRF